MTAPRRILIVDDDEDIRTVTRVALEGDGYRVESVASGREALRAAADGQFDLMLLDVNMPGMDGWETLSLIKADEGCAGLPVVMFTVKGEVRDKVHGMQEGAVDFITKPFVVDELLRRVRRVLECADRGAATP